MITLSEAVTAFLVWIPFTIGITYWSLGETGVITFAPIWALSLIYPFMKRLIPFPQLILGAIIGGAVFPGWAAVTNDLSNLQEALPLFLATMSWVVYFDVFYATQVSSYAEAHQSRRGIDSNGSSRIAPTMKKSASNRSLFCWAAGHGFSLPFWGFFRWLFLPPRRSEPTCRLSSGFWVLGCGR